MSLNPKLHEKKLTIMAMVLILVFVFCNSFFTLYYFLKYHKVIGEAEKQYLYPTACVFTVLNSSVNVIIYGIFDMKFRRIFISLFLPCQSSESNNEDRIGNTRSTSILQYHKNCDDVSEDPEKVELTNIPNKQ